MSRHAEIQFHTGLPDDTVAEGNEIVRWPGLNIAGTLKVALEPLGYRVSDPINAQEQGWELDIWRGPKRLWLQIAIVSPDECYISAENMTFWLWPDRKLFQAFLSDLRGILEADGRFGQIN